MVRARRHSIHLHSVLPRPRTAAQTRAPHDARGGGGDPGMVHAPHAARDGARLRLRLSALPEEEMAADIWPDFDRGDAAILPPAALQPVLCGASRRLVR